MGVFASGGLFIRVCIFIIASDGRDPTPRLLFPEASRAVRGINGESGGRKPRENGLKREEDG